MRRHEQLSGGGGRLTVMVDRCVKKRTVDSLGKTLFRLRNLLASLPLVYALLSTRWEFEDEWVVWPLATALTLAGFALRSWASAHSYYRRERERRLARTGPYALIRNPLYAGNLLIIAGLTLASELAWLLPIALIWVWAVYSLVCIGYEERRLLRWYGEEYRQYRSAVPAWIPVGTAIAGSGPLPWRLLMSETPKFLLLLPFLLKELDWPGLGH